MSYTPVPNPMPVKIASTDDVMQQILTELRIMNLYLHQLPRYLNDGTGFSAGDEPKNLADQLKLK